MNKIGIGLVGAILLGEFSFYIYMKTQAYPIIQPFRSDHTPWFRPPKTLILQIFNILHLIPDYSMCDYLSKFFKMASFDSITRRDYQSFLGWVLYVKDWEHITTEEQALIYELCTYTETHFALKWPTSNQDRPMVRPNAISSYCKCTLEPITCFHYPLVYYTGIKVISLLGDIQLYKRGFRKWGVNRASYWIHECKGSTLPPLLLFHGICIGWNNFMSLIQMFLGSRTIVLYNYDCVKRHSLSFYMQGAPELGMDIDIIQKRHGITKFAVLATSWGTFLAGWLVRVRPEVITFLGLVEPVALTVMFPDTMYTIQYKPPTDWFEYALCFFLRKDPTIANAICRNHSWFNLQLNLDEIPKHIHICIGMPAKDSLMHVNAVPILYNQEKERRESIENAAGIELFIWDDIQHGDGLSKPHSISDVVGSLNAFEQQTDMFV